MKRSLWRFAPILGLLLMSGAVRAQSFDGPNSVVAAGTVTTVFVWPYIGCGLYVSAVGSGNTIIAEGSMDNVTWTTRQVYSVSGQTTASSITATGQYSVLMAPGDLYERCRVSVYGSGVVTARENVNNIGATLTYPSGAAGSSNVTIVGPLGQALAAASIPVILPSATITTLTPPSNTGYALDATLTGGTQQTKITDATTVANVAPASGSQTGQGALQVASTFQTQAFSFGSSTTGTVYDLGSYRTVSVQIAANASANTITFQTSNDNATWVSASLVTSSTGTGAAVQTTSGVGLFVGQVQGRYFRLNCTSFVSGTTTGTMVFYTLGSSQTSMGVNAAQNGTWTVQVGNTPNTTPILASNVAGGNTQTVAANLQAYVSGGAATNSTIGTAAGNEGYPVNNAAQGVTSENSAVTTGNSVQLVADVQGRLIVTPYANKENLVRGTASQTSTTSTSIIAGVASNNLYITSINCFNSGATAGVDAIQDGSGGTTIWEMGVPAGGGSIESFPSPMKVPTAGNGLFFAPSGGSTTNYCSATGFSGK